MVSFINGGACFVNGGGYFVNGGGSFINSGGSFTNGGGYFINSGGSFINGGGSFVNGGSTWDIYTPSIPANNDIKFVDIDIDIANSYKIYACTNGTSGVPAEIWSIDIITNLPWSKITTITDMGFAKPQIDFSSLEPSNIFIAYRDNATTNNLVIKKSIDGGVNWSTIFNNTNSSLNVHLRPWGNSKWMFEMSEIDINTIYFSANVMFRKTANAPGFFAFSQYIPDENPYSTHADVRDLEIKKNSSNDNDILLIGHDGGLARTYEGLSATVREWNNLNGNTLNNSEFYGFDYYPTGDDIIGGLQDNGGFHKKTGNWNIIFNNADGAMALVNKEDENISYIVQNGGGYNAILKSTKKENYLEIDINYPEPSINGLKSFPMILDPTNNNFLWYGVYDLHRYDSKNNSWFTFNSSSLGTGADGNFSSIAIAPANNQIIYAAYEHPQWDNNLDAIKLIRSLDGGTTFTDLTIHTNTNNPFIYAGITEIIVDPNNYNHLFVATNGNNNKVYEVTVSGNSITWSDLSAGILQDAKVFSLNYYEGSNGILFAGTNNGLYKMDYTQTTKQWVQYGIGMPNTVISQIKINNCRNKLIVSTFGRGMWEIDINPNTKPNAIEINTNQTWSGYKKYYTDVFVKSGTTLTIEGTVSFEKNVFLIIEPDAKVIVDGGRLMSSSGCKWGGVIVEGNPLINQFPESNQGYIELKNNAIVEGANTAISTTSHNFVNGIATTINWSKVGGGIIIANKTTFKNNNRHIEFLAYKNIYPNGQEYKNASLFVNCTFEMSGSAYTGITEYTKGRMVTAWGVKDVRFNACDFKNTNGTLNVDLPKYHRGTGMFSIDASLNVSGYVNTYCNLIKAGTFKDLSTGIFNVESPSATRISVYKYLNFSLNDKSIRLSDGNTTTIHNNTFDLNIPDNYYNKKYSLNNSPLTIGIAGIYASRTGAFLIEKNNFIYNPALHSDNYKIIVSNVIDENGSNQTGGNVRLNTFTGPNFGTQTQNNNPSLEIKCNTYQQLQTSGAGINLNPNSIFGSTPSFGDCRKLETRKDYKNEFISNMNYDIQNVPSIVKTYVVEPSAINIPSSTKVLRMNINKCVADGIVTPKEPCTITPSLACGEIVTNPDPTLGKTKYNLAAEAITTLNNEINSGSLSEAALEEALIAKTYHINEQEQARGNVIWSYNTWETLDSTINAVDSIITFLSADGCLANKKLLVGTLYGAARYSLASQALSNINTDGTEELVNFINYYNLLINVNLNNRNIFRLDSNELIILNQIAATNSSAAQSAKGILTFVYGNYYDDANIERIIDSENFGNTTKVTPVEISKVASVETQNVLITYPNPANNTITIKYTIVNKGPNNSISINDITGKTVFFRKVLQVQANSTIDIDTKEWANGTYVVILTNSKYGSVTSKIVIAH